MTENVFEEDEDSGYDTKGVSSQSRVQEEGRQTSVQNVKEVTWPMSKLRQCDL